MPILKFFSWQAMVPLVAVLGLAFYWYGWERTPGYPAEDYDLRLTREARTAKPIIAALAEYHAKNGAYPKDPRALQPLLPEIGGYSEWSVGRWNYGSVRNETGYQLIRKIGMDIGLFYKVEGTRAEWLYGDGEEMSPVKFDLQ